MAEMKDGGNAPKEKEPVTLEHIHEHFHMMEKRGRRRSELDLVFNSGFGFIAIGIGLIPAGLSLASQKLPYWPGMVYGGAVAVVIGWTLMGIVARIDARQNKTGDSH